MFLAILEFVFVDLSNNLINKTPQNLNFCGHIFLVLLSI